MFKYVRRYVQNLAVPEWLSAGNSVSFLRNFVRSKTGLPTTKVTVVHVMNNWTVLVRYPWERESSVSACDLSAPERSLKDTDTSEYHQYISADITRSRVLDPPEESSTEASDSAETPHLPVPPSELTLTETPMEATLGEESHGSAVTLFVMDGTVVVANWIDVSTNSGFPEISKIWKTAQLFEGICAVNQCEESVMSINVYCFIPFTYIHTLIYLLCFKYALNKSLK